MIITISGTEASGKSVVGEMLAKKLGYKYYSIGDIRRQMAADMGLTLAEFNKLGETQDFTDKKVDGFQKNLGKTQDDFVMNGRIAYHFIPNSLKVFLFVSPEVGAKRALNDPNRKGEKFQDAADAMRILKERRESDRKRYEKYYGIKDIFDKTQYDFALDTSNLSIEQVLAAVLAAVEKKKAEKAKTKQPYEYTGCC